MKTVYILVFTLLAILEPIELSSSRPSLWDTRHSRESGISAFGRQPPPPPYGDKPCDLVAERKYYEEWTLPDGVQVKAVKENAEGHQSLFTLEPGKNYNWLRSESGQLLGVKMNLETDGDLHALYDNEDKRAVLNKKTKLTRPLEQDEEEFLNECIPMYMLGVSADELHELLRRMNT